ncbi:MAG: prenyltransferase, partial [Acidimicrobiia bacterium]|nr:prenyltransferase [Acidimicrobiia bacterium]
STALALGALLAVAGHSAPAAAIGAVTIGVAWSYSMPPLRLVASGFGEIAASGVVAGAVPLVGYLVQDGSAPDELWWSIAVLFPIHFAMILSFELPDVESDAAAGKRVLAVRIGRHRTVVLIGGSMVAAGAIAAVGGTTGGLPMAAAVATLAGIIPASLMALALVRNRYWLLTSAAVATLVVVGVGLVVGLRV